jgi:hypothetical protein
MTYILVFITIVSYVVFVSSLTRVLGDTHGRNEAQQATLKARELDLARVQGIQGSKYAAMLMEMRARRIQ